MTKPFSFLSFVVLSFLLLPSFAVAEEGSNPDDDGNERYIELLPAFVVNYGTYAPRLKYFKAEVTVRVPSKADADIIRENMDMLRDKLVLLFSRQTEIEISDPNAQMKLQEQALAVLQEKLVAEFEKELITDVLFTSFIVQR